MKRREFVTLIGVGAMLHNRASAMQNSEKQLYYFELLNAKTRNIDNFPKLKSSSLFFSKSLEALGYKRKELVYVLEKENAVYFVPFEFQVGDLLIDKVYLVFNSSFDKISTINLDFINALEALKYELNAEFSRQELVALFTPKLKSNHGVKIICSDHSNVEFVCRINENAKEYTLKVNLLGVERIFMSNTLTIA